MQIRLLIVEDHPLYAEALQSAISRAMTNVKMFRVATIAEAVKVLADLKDIDLAILDLKLPDSSGLEGLIEIRTRAPSLPVLINSTYAEPDVVHNALVCGAVAFIPKATTKHVLLDAICDVLDGKKPGLRGESRLTGYSESTRPLTRCGALTRQQMRVLQMVCQGLLNKQIAHNLGINESTVKAHVSEILRKLRVSSRTQAVVTISNLGGPLMQSQLQNEIVERPLTTVAS